MAHIAGIKTQTNTRGVVTKVTVNLKKHPQAKIALTKPLVATL